MELKFSILFKFQLVNMVENPGIDDRAKQEPCLQIQCLKRDPPPKKKYNRYDNSSLAEIGPMQHFDFQRIQGSMISDRGFSAEQGRGKTADYHAFLVF